MKPPPFLNKVWASGGGKGPRLLPEYRFQGIEVMLLQLFRAAGIAPVSIHRRRTGCGVTLSSNQMLYCFVMYTIIGLIIIVGFSIDVFVNPLGTVRNTIAKVLCSLNVSFALCFVVASAIRSSARTTRLLNFLKQAQKINEEFGKSASAANDRRLHLQFLFIIVVKLCTFVLKILRLIFISKQGLFISTYIFFCSYMNNFIVLLLEMQIMLVVQYMKKMVQTINNEMKVLLKEMQTNKGAAGEAESLKKIRHITDKYLEGRNLIKQLSDSEGGLLLCIFIIIVFYVNTSSYRVYVSFQMPYSYLKVWKIIERFVICFHHWISFALLIEPCHQTRQELEQTRVLVSELLCGTPSALSPLSWALQGFAKQLQVSSRIFTPLGVFTFSRSLYTAVIGCVTTFFSIVIKYKLTEWNTGV